MFAMILPAILDLALKIISWLISKNANNEELKKAFKEFAELARTANIKTIEQRKHAETQIEAGNAVWDNEEKKTKK